MSDLNRKFTAAKDFLELYYNPYNWSDEDSPFLNSRICDAFAGVAVHLQEKLKRDVVISDVVFFFMKDSEKLIDAFKDILTTNNDAFGSTLVLNLCHLYSWDYDCFKERISEIFSDTYATLPDFSTYVRTTEEVEKARQSIFDAEEAVLKQPRR